MRILVLLFFILLMVTACTGNPQDIGITQSLETFVQVTVTPKTSSTLIPTADSTPIATKQKNSTPTAVPRMTPTPEVEICSPLVIHPLDELQEIIGDPYQPPRQGREERHHGIDFAYYHYRERDSMLGEPVQSVLPGRVASVLDDQYPYGNMVMVETSRDDLPEYLVEELEMLEEDSLYVLYAHMDQPPLVSLGEWVQSCQQLGEVGMSGNTDIPHLHIETRIGPAGHLFESMRFYDTRATLEELAAYELWRTSGVFQHFDPMKLLGKESGDREISGDE